MTLTPVEISISVKVSWWVRPFIFLCAVLIRFGFPIDPEGRMERIVMAGIIPVVK